MTLIKKIMNINIFFSVTLLGISIKQNPSPNFLLRYDEDSHQQISPTLLVLHYTAESLERVKEIFSMADVPAPVSAHYTIDSNGSIHQHVSENLAARHAGVASWQNLEGSDPLQKKLNLHSLGIEHVNLGFKVDASQPEGIVVKGSDKEWYPFDQRQIEASIILCKDILARNKQIKPHNILGHSDIAPRRKHDPGPLFPWKKFAEHGIGVWPDVSKIQPMPCIDNCLDEACKNSWFIKHAHMWGYRTPDLQVSTEDIVRAFQMHFRPENIDGKIDDETIALLKALISEHILKGGICPCQKH
ncbi:MAG: N-acetylmuramoyl-L-alanine amidase [Candidatus Babeliaceae bacterium]|nr:N-acetylmuramoyl-L-alanine amidase [Candidatus Babeliaceae bacterium]